MSSLSSAVATLYTIHYESERCREQEQLCSGLRETKSKLKRHSFFPGTAVRLLAECSCRGKPLSCQAPNPPANGRTRVMPCLRKSSATRALVASLGQVQ